MKYRATRFVGLFCKIQVTQTPGAFIYFERVADLKRSSMWMCSHGQKCRKMEYGNGHRRCLSRWMMKHAKKIAQDKEWEKGRGRRTISRHSFFPPFSAEDVCTLSTCTTLLKVGHRYPSLSRTLPNLLLFFFCYTSLPLAPFILSV